MRLSGNLTATGKVDRASRRYGGAAHGLTRSPRSPEWHTQTIYAQLNLLPRQEADVGQYRTSPASINYVEVFDLLTETSGAYLKLSHVCGEQHVGPIRLLLQLHVLSPINSEKLEHMILYTSSTNLLTSARDLCCNRATSNCFVLTVKRGLITQVAKVAPMSTILKKLFLSSRAFQ